VVELDGPVAFLEACPYSFVMFMYKYFDLRKNKDACLLMCDLQDFVAIVYLSITLNQKNHNAVICCIYHKKYLLVLF